MSDVAKKNKMKAKATKLRIFTPPTVRLNTEKAIKLRALTDGNKVDKSRNDTLEVTLNEEAVTKFKDGSKKVQVKLVNGEAEVVIMTPTMREKQLESIIFNVNWIDGPSRLNRIVTSCFIGELMV